MEGEIYHLVPRVEVRGNPFLCGDVHGVGADVCDVEVQILVDHDEVEDREVEGNDAAEVVPRGAVVRYAPAAERAMVDCCLRQCKNLQCSFVLFENHQGHLELFQLAQQLLLSALVLVENLQFLLDSNL